MNIKIRWSVAFVLTTLARVAAAALFLLWGAFFVEHVTEWFLQESGFPPGVVWVGQVLHGALLCALAFLVFRPRAGALATLIATLAFFGWIGVLNYLPAITLAPVMLVALAWLARSLSARQPPAGVPAQ